MSVGVVMTVFLQAAEFVASYEELLSGYGETTTCIDDENLYPFTVSVGLKWDFTNEPISKIIELATEIDCNIQFDVYPTYSEFEIIGFVSGDEESAFGFHYTLNCHDFLNNLARVDKVLFCLNVEKFELIDKADFQNVDQVETNLYRSFFLHNTRFGLDSSIKSINDYRILDIDRFKS